MGDFRKFQQQIEACRITFFVVVDIIVVVLLYSNKHSERIHSTPPVEILLHRDAMYAPIDVNAKSFWVDFAYNLSITYSKCVRMCVVSI